MDIDQLRKEYSMGELHKVDLESDPMDQFAKWFDEALKVEMEPNALALCTVDQNSLPSCRMVLLKGFDKNGFKFFTHYTSRKAKELELNPHAAMTFFWKNLERQVNIEGPVEMLSAIESDEYFAKRPRASQISVYASKQDEPVTSRHILEEQFKHYEKKYQDDPIPRPFYWGGFRLIPHRIEFWQGRESRLHDRFEYVRNGEKWIIKRLSS